MRDDVLTKQIRNGKRGATLVAMIESTGGWIGRPEKGLEWWYREDLIDLADLLLEAYGLDGESDGYFVELSCDPKWRRRIGRSRPSPPTEPGKSKT